MEKHHHKPSLIFSCSWGRNKETSWSGTDFQILNELSKTFRITNYDYGIRKPFTFFNKIKERIFKNSKTGWDLEEHYVERMKHKFSKGTYNAFQFSQCPNQDNINSFLYIDLCFGVIQQLAISNPEIFHITDYSQMTSQTLFKFETKQANFYKNHAKLIFTMGNWLKKWIIEHYSLSDKKVIAVGAGYNVNPSLIDYSKKAGNKILFVGKDFRRKNGPLVIKAFKLAKLERPDIELFIVGGENRTAYEDGIEGIHFEGLQSFRNEVSFFNLCDVFCMPSLFEAYGIVFPEALTYGLPVIGNNCFEMPYIIQDGINGYLLQHNDPRELSKIMLKALSNHEMQQKVKNDKRKYVEKYSWETIGKKIVTEILNFN